jgi:hypothetical protein
MLGAWRRNQAGESPTRPDGGLQRGEPNQNGLKTGGAGPVRFSSVAARSPLYQRLSGPALEKDEDGMIKGPPPLCACKSCVVICPSAPSRTTFSSITVRKKGIFDLDDRLSWRPP